MNNEEKEDIVSRVRKCGSTAPAKVQLSRTALAIHALELLFKQNLIQHANKINQLLNLSS